MNDEHVTSDMEEETLVEEVEDTRCYKTLSEFVEGYISHIYNRKRVGNAHYWCKKWWAHPEAAARLGALWHAWEHLRLADPNEGMARWFVQYGDPIMRELTSPNGTFYHCKDEEHRVVNEPEGFLNTVTSEAFK